MTRSGISGLLLCACLALLVGVGSANAEFVKFDVIPAFAPLGPQSPSWNGYVINALAGIQNNVDVGDRTVSPNAYERVTSQIGPEELLYTDWNGSGFNSWRGAAAPTPLPVGFEGEFGNRIHFGLHIIADGGAQFALHDLAWELDSDDVDNYFDQSGDFSLADYSATRIGINYGADGQKGGTGANADTVLNAGQDGSSLINELIYVGVGDGFYVAEPGLLTDQEQIDLTIGDILAGCSDPTGCLVDVMMTYSLTGETSGTASNKFTIYLVPEPSTALLAVLGLVALVGRSRRRR